MTIAALNAGGDADALGKAYIGLLDAFDDYMANYNHGRGIVFMGHSQGAMLLISLLEDKVETAPEVEKLLVSALLMGGSATTAPGKTTGGDFTTIPTCASVTETGCVVGYSSFGETPPPDAMFGRSATAVGMLRPPNPGEQIMCAEPRSPGRERDSTALDCVLGSAQGCLLPTESAPRYHLHLVSERLLG